MRENSNSITLISIDQWCLAKEVCQSLLHRIDSWLIHQTLVVSNFN